MRASVRVKRRGHEARCSFCHDAIVGTRETCRCGATYHEACRRELGRCATLGCRPVAPRAVVWGAGAPAPPIVAMDEDEWRNVGAVLGALLAGWLGSGFGNGELANMWCVAVAAVVGLLWGWTLAHAALTRVPRASLAATAAIAAGFFGLVAASSPRATWHGTLAPIALVLVLLGSVIPALAAVVISSALDDRR